MKTTAFAKQFDSFNMYMHAHTQIKEIAFLSTCLQSIKPVTFQKYTETTEVLFKNCVLKSIHIFITLKQRSFSFSLFT